MSTTTQDAHHQRPAAVAPYTLQVLADNLPLDNSEEKDVKITCVEAWDGNLYIGTSSHEVVHVVAIPPTPHPGPNTSNEFTVELPTYIQGTRQKPAASAVPATQSSTRPFIKQILLLANQGRALVLSSTGLLTFYSLPEFSPAWETVKVKDIQFMVLDSNDYKNQEADNDRDAPQTEGVQVLLCGKKNVRVIKVGEDVRLIRRIDLPGTIHAARQGPISCVATDTDYALLDIENSGKISLPSIVSSSESTELSSNTVEIPDERRNPSPAPSSKGSSRSNTPLGTKSHPPRTSSLQRARSGDFSGHSKDAKEELKAPTPSKHARAVSTGSIRGVSPQPSSEKKAAGLPTRSRSTNGGSAGLLFPPTSSRRSSTTSRSPSPRAPSLQDGESEGGSPAGQEEPPAPSTTSKSQSPSPANTPPKSQTPPPTEPALETPDTVEAVVAKPKPKEKVQLKPNIITPSATEFLITTGTGKCDPGVGIFVDINGDVTRGTINFERYPERLLLDSDGWLLSLLSQGPDKRTMIEIFKWDENQEERGIVELPSEEEQDGIGIKDVKSEISFSVADIGRRLMFVRIIPTERGNEHNSRKLEVWEESRMDEEIQAARRISGAESRILLWNNTKIWGLVRSPSVLKLDGRLPMDFSGNANGAKMRIQAVMKVLKDVEGQQPETERHFHELAYIRQKSGMLLLAELLASSHSLDTGTVLAVESVLLEGGLDPRVVVALFPSFKKEVIEGKQGLWVYAGIKQVYDALLERDNKFSGGEADLETGTLLILKRYLAAWRSKKGFGSVLDEKEVFLTVDAVLLSVLLRLDSSATTDDMIKTSSHAELYKLVDSGLDCFDRAVEILEEHKRLYLLSWLYQSKKKVTEVLQTWRRILESEDGDEEFVDGEERMKEYLIARRTKELVLDYGVWLAGRNPDIGFRVFADPRARIKWEHREVLEILKEKAPLAYRKFLEHLVHDNKVAEYAKDLISMYLDELLSTLENDQDTRDVLEASYLSYRALESPKPTYRVFIEENSSGNRWWSTRLRFLDLLADESSYEVEELLERLHPWQKLLVAELVIIYGKDSRHSEALKLLCHELGDFDTAVNYCLFGAVSIFKTERTIKTKEEQSELFKLLLIEFLALEDAEASVKQTCSLLQRFGSWLNVEDVLDAIPEPWPVCLVSAFLTTSLRYLIKEKNEANIAKALSRSINLRITAEYVDKCDKLGPTIQDSTHDPFFPSLGSK